MLEALKIIAVAAVGFALAGLLSSCEENEEKKDEASSVAFRIRNGEKAGESDFPFVGML